MEDSLTGSKQTTPEAVDPAAPGNPSVPGDASAGRAPFFRILPMDLQVCVLRHWLGEANDPRRLLSVSFMDIACCNRADRSAFLELACHPLQLWLTCKPRSKDLRCFMLWLSSRRVAVNSLMVTESNLSAVIQRCEHPLAAAPGSACISQCCHD